MEMIQEKKLSQLVDKAFVINTVEDFVRLVGEQVAPMKKKIGEIILCCQSAYLGPRQYCLKNKRLFERTPKKIWPTIDHFRLNQKEDSIYLANELGRPFYKALVLPLHSPYKKEYHFPTLFIEYFSKDETIENIFSSERKNILQSAFSKVLIEEHWKSGCELWKQTFDSLEEPLTVVDEHKQPIRSNIHFQNIYQNHPKILNQNTFHQSGKVYEKQSYLIQNEEQSYRIHHFVDVTSEKLLREKMAQNKRMSILGQLADDIAHELNNPLTGIRSMAQIIHQELEDSATKDVFIEIEKATNRCQKIIKNFIQFSKQTTWKHSCDLNEVVKQTIPFLKTMIQTKKIQLNLTSNPLWVSADPCSLQQVIFNLIKNALEAVEKEGLVVIASQKEKNKAHFSVTDNGCGISPEHSQNLFNPFFTTKKNGNGLGLRISSQWIQKFGGKLTFHSTPNKGSCFTFCLPQCKKESYENSYY